MKLKEVKDLINECDFIHIGEYETDEIYYMNTCRNLDELADKKLLDYQVISIKPMSYQLTNGTLHGLEFKVREEVK